MKHLQHLSQAGYSLGELLVVVALTGLGAVIGTSIFNQWIIAQKMTVASGVEDDIRRAAFKQLTCDELLKLNANTCAEKSSSAVLHEDGSEEFEINSRFKVSASCRKDSEAYLFEWKYNDENHPNREMTLLADTPTVCAQTCDGYPTADGCFYGVGQYTKHPIDAGLPNRPLSCDDFCSTRGGSSPIGLTCAQCEPLFAKLYSGPSYACSDVSPSNYNVLPDPTIVLNPDNPPSVTAAYAGSCNAFYLRYGTKGMVAFGRFAPDQPYYHLAFGKIIGSGSASWASYICRCKR